METIFATGFGRVVDIQKGQSDQLTEAAAGIFSVAHEDKITSVLYGIMLLSKIECCQKLTLSLKLQFLSGATLYSQQVALVDDQFH